MTSLWFLLRSEVGSGETCCLRRPGFPLHCCRFSLHLFDSRCFSLCVSSLTFPLSVFALRLLWFCRFGEQISCLVFHYLRRSKQQKTASSARSVLLRCVHAVNTCAHSVTHTAFGPSSGFCSFAISPLRALTHGGQIATIAEEFVFR